MAAAPAEGVLERKQDVVQYHKPFHSNYSLDEKYGLLPCVLVLSGMASSKSTRQSVVYEPLSEMHGNGNRAI